MSKRVLSIGQCSVDHAAISSLVKGQFGAEIVSADSGDEAIAALGRGKFDLVMVNRKLDADYSDGLDVIRRIKADPNFSATPCMLVTNYAEHQETAVAAGAEPGFGKSGYHDPATHEKLAKFLK
jgi:two-component system, chemotaxis family, chemotaxis protein CheY